MSYMQLAYYAYINCACVLSSRPTSWQEFIAQISFLQPHNYRNLYAILTRSQKHSPEAAKTNNGGNFCRARTERSP